MVIHLDQPQQEKKQKKVLYNVYIKKNLVKIQSCTYFLENEQKVFMIPVKKFPYAMFTEVGDPIQLHI